MAFKAVNGLVLSLTLIGFLASFSLLASCGDDDETEDDIEEDDDCLDVYDEKDDDRWDECNNT